MRRGSAFLVSFRGALTADALQALSDAGLSVVGGHGGGALPPEGGELMKLDHRTVRVRATSKEEAMALVRVTVSPHGTFGDFSAQEEVGG